MNVLNRILMIMLCILPLQADTHYKNVIVVGSEVNVPSLSKNELENIFLGKQTLWEDGSRIHISLSLTESEKLQEFFHDIIGKSERRYKKYWLKRVFSGYGIAPKIFTDNKKAIRYLKREGKTISFLTIENESDLQDLQVVLIDGKKFF